MYNGPKSTDTINKHERYYISGLYTDTQMCKWENNPKLNENPKENDREQLLTFTPFTLQLSAMFSAS